MMGLTYFFMDECDEWMCRHFSLCGELLLLMLPCDALCLCLFVRGHQSRTRYRLLARLSGHQSEYCLGEL